MGRLPTTEERPDGLVYRPDLIWPADERALLDVLDRIEFHEIRMHGVVAKRTARHYGLDYDYERRGVIEEAEPVPDWLLPVRERAAGLAGVRPEDLAEILVQRVTAPDATPRVERPALA